MRSRLELLVNMRLNELTNRAEQLIDQIAEKGKERNALNQRKEELKHQLASIEANLYFSMPGNPKTTLKDKEYLLEKVKAESEEYQKYLTESNNVTTDIANLTAEEQRLSRRFSLTSSLIDLRAAMLNFLAGESVEGEGR